MLVILPVLTYNESLLGNHDRKAGEAFFIRNSSNKSQGEGTGGK